MSSDKDRLSVELIESQRKRLEHLQAELLAAERKVVVEVRTAREEHGDEVHEFEDLAQDQARDEIRQALHDVDGRRVADVERALQKIQEGTYGVSDLSSAPIPKRRLEVVPEARHTVEEAVSR